MILAERRGSEWKSKYEDHQLMMKQSDVNNFRLYVKLPDLNDGYKRDAEILINFVGNNDNAKQYHLKPGKDLIAYINVSKENKDGMCYQDRENTGLTANCTIKGIEKFLNEKGFRGKLKILPYHQRIEEYLNKLNRQSPSHGIENNYKEETKMAKEFKHEEWMDKAKASEKQLAFASKLGLKTEEMLDMTYAQAHEKIEERLKEPASEKQIARAKVLDVEIGENPTKCQLYGQMRKQYFENQKLPATEKQIELAKKMHLEIGDNPTKGELSKMIGNAIEESEKKPATEKQIELCRELGIEIGDEPKLRDLSRKIAEFNKNKELQDKSKENTDKDKSASLSKENEQSKEREQEKGTDKGMER